MNTVSEAWVRIHDWLSRKAPKILKNLNPGAGDAEIIAAERALGSNMPDEWKELYRVHNGMNDEGNFGSLFFGMQFRPLDRVVNEHATNAANIKELGQEYHPLVVKAADPGIRTHDTFNLRWFALSHDCGDTFLRIDMDPAEGGRIGQVIFTDHADDVVIRVAPSLLEFLRRFVDDLESDRYFLNPEALADGDEFLNCAKEIDIVNWFHSPTWEYMRKKRYPNR